MANLYPPIIEGTIPAFYGTTLVVPFSMNRAVSKIDIKGFSLKIKTIQTNTFVANIESISYTTSEAKFNIEKANLVPGQYYKIQLAYISNDEYSTVGYYSTVGVVKYYGLEGPKIYIDGLSNKKSNLFAGYYLGVFEHKEDPMEKIAQYRFVITYTNSGEIFYDTGWRLHNTINDTNSLSANDAFKYTDDLDDDTTYYLQYQVITSNKMECASPKYNILQKNSIGSTLNLQFTATPDYDNGFMLLKLKSLGSAGENATLTGAFEISRRNMKNPRHWEVIDLFILQNEVATKTFWRDFTITHGENYQYAIRQFNEAGVYTSRVLSNEVFADFEDAFLFDGQRQLKIRFNPKVSSFKNDIPESKTDTIGSKYPFIFRNGHVNYKEFPISGLISYLGDEQELFLTNEEIGIVDITNWSRNKTNSDEELPVNAKTTDLTTHNIAAERRFKLEVLEWLTNGKAKLFRSPAEGNYIVRLLNTNLTPTDSVGRMLHTFSCTAYEVADCTYENLVNFGFIDNGLSEEEKQRKYYRTVPLGYQTHENDNQKYDEGYIPIITGKNPNYKADDFGYIELLSDPYSNNVLKATAIYFDDMVSNDVIWVDGKKILIGNTGQYILEKTENITSVKIRAIPGYYIDTEDNKIKFDENKVASDRNQWEENVRKEYFAKLEAERASVALKNWTNEKKTAYLINFANELNNYYNPILEDIANSPAYDYNYILNDYEGLFTYKYTDMYANSFDLITGQKLIDVPCKQFIGEKMDNNILNELVDVRTELLGVLQIQADLKQIEDIYTWADAAAFESMSMSYEDFNNWFSFDKVKMPGEDKGHSYGDITNQVFNPQKNSLYIYKIHPIFQHKDYQLDAEIPDNYIESLSPWELEELRQQVVEMLSKYDLTLDQVSEFVRYRNNGIEDKIQQIKLVVNDFLLLEKYYGKKEFNYNTSGEDPHDSHPQVITVYNNGKWEEVPVEYHRNEGYYVDATYYSTDPYHEFNKYYLFDKDYYLVYKNGYYKVVEGYSSRIYINTGVATGVTEANGELYTPDGKILEPYIDLANTGSFRTTLIPEITDIYVGDGVILNLSYQAREISYIVEDTNSKLKQLRDEWQDAVNGYTGLFYERKNTVEELYDFHDDDWRANYNENLLASKNYLAKINDTKEEYLKYLEEKIERYKEDRGIE